MTEQDMKNWSAVDELRLLRDRLLNASTPYCTHQREVVFWDRAKAICDRSIKKMVKIEALKQVSWTPIEKATDWDGDAGVDVTEWQSGHDPYWWESTVTVDDVRETAKEHPDTRFFIYPAPPKFNPSDYEVKS